MAYRILILGDSSSSGIGLGKSCYPAKLVFHLHEAFGVHVSNFAVPGFTSADASRFFHTVVAKRPFDYIIIYLGNNEGAASIPKGYYSPLKARLTACFSRHPGRQFRPILSPPRFRFRYEVPPSTIAITPTEFRDNLRSIVRGATKQGAKVIIVNPIANHQYPCGVGVTNSSYLCYLDNLDQLGYTQNNEPIDETSETVAAGLRYFLSGQWDKAAKVWEPLISINNVAGFIARHNLACARVRMGDHTSEEQLRALIGEYDSYDSTVLYNLAQLKRRQGEDMVADDLLEQALEKDISIYRIRREYRDVIAAFALTNGVRVLDLESVLNPSHFVDYCHPTEEGHEEIARALAAFIRSDRRLPGGPEDSSYEVILPTPNYLYDPRQTLLEYYCIDWPIDEKRIRKLMTAVRTGEHNLESHDRELFKCIENFFRSNRRHPIFTTNMNLVGTWSPRSNEILSFPEFFVYRILYNYSLAFENALLMESLSAAPVLAHMRFSAADYNKIILRSDDRSLDIELDTRREYYTAVIKNIKRWLLESDQIFRVTLGERIRTVMTWYTRESFRYGTQSRMSMLYSRWDIDKIIEGLIVVIVMAHKLDDRVGLQGLDRLMSHVLDLVGIHEQHVQLYHRHAKEFSFAKYQEALVDVRNSVESGINAIRD